jgi:tripartite-type tricarboxylate transporter receptor subunit TctC
MSVSPAHRSRRIGLRVCDLRYTRERDGTGRQTQEMRAPKNTPSEIIEKINHAVNAALLNPDFKARLTDLGAEPFVSSTAEFARFNADYTEKWGKVIRAANIKAE